MLSIDRVRSELFTGHKTEDLVVWVKEQAPAERFVGADDKAVTKAYGQVMLWVQRNPQYFDYAKVKYATVADGWLVAYAMVHDVYIVTNEQHAPDSKREIKLPDVCEQFDVPYMDTFMMLADLGVRYDLRAPS